jgi:hypothetical protein
MRAAGGRNDSRAAASLTIEVEGWGLELRAPSGLQGI